MGCAGPKNLIHEGPTSQLKVSAANILMPDTTEHLQRSCGVNAAELFWQY